MPKYSKECSAVLLYSASTDTNLHGELYKGENRRLRFASWSREIIVIDFLVSGRSFILPLFLACLPSVLSTVCLPPFCILKWSLLCFLFVIFPLCLSTFSPLTLTTIHLFPCHIRPSSLYPSILYSLPCGQDALTCICLAWMSPRFGLNAPIILVNYDVLLWAMLLRLCASHMKAGTAQQSHLQRLD